MINAYAAHAPGAALESFQFDPGPLAADEVEIAVEYCGICHSDLSMIDNDWGRSQYPLVPGHEVIGKVAARGTNVTDLQIGDAVGLGWHAGYCLQCEICDVGDHNLCIAAQPTIIGRHGGFADRVRAASASVIKLPPGLARDSAGPLFCGGITVFNPLLEFGIQATDKVAVIGIGGLGHLALKFLRAWGCDVTAFTSSEAKTAEALQMGAHRTVDSTDRTAIAACADSFDLIISTVDASLDWSTYLDTLKARGRLHFVGVPAQPLELAVPMLLRRQKSVSASPVGSPRAIAIMLEFALAHGISADVEEFAASDINAALERLRSGQARYRVVLNMQGPK